AWITPIVMKKGRPAYTVSVLGDPALVDQLSAVLAAETGSLGVRGRRLERWPAARADAEVEVEGLPVRVKISAGRVKVEHDDAARAARRTGLPLREVLSRAEAAWHTRQPLDTDPA
ncbi:MAG TPA: nickel insertion protein, partial [Acidimicrobiales bacterium]|nr:nickel insertion protein [Acidimicrobiales bacterium]